MKLTGKVALVSGAGGGIGRAISLAFAEAGRGGSVLRHRCRLRRKKPRVLPEMPEAGQSPSPAMFPSRSRPKPLRRRRTRHSAGSISW